MRFKKIKKNFSDIFEKWKKYGQSNEEYLSNKKKVYGNWSKISREKRGQRFSGEKTAWEFPVKIWFRWRRIGTIRRFFLGCFSRKNFFVNDRKCTVFVYWHG